ncbi:MAG: DnaJ domain-containing protein [Planctomycetaceae bacterium]|nr:DnaJ domain-containing protein [Planctomycetaceae bacterium]
MANHDYYETLGVSRKASQEEIRKAYKKLAREYHPDNRPDDPEAEKKFKEIQEANSVLSDPEKRAQYDRFGSAFQNAGAGGGPGQPFHWSTSGQGGAGAVDLEDILGGGFDLGDLFGGGFGGGQQRHARSQPRPRAGQDIEMEIEIPFQVAVEGGQHSLPLRKQNGNVERLNVKVPAGVDTGSVIRLSGQGHPGMQGGPPGNLRLTVKVAPHPYFRREGNRILVDVPITACEAVLGTKVEVPTVKEGKVTVTIPPGTSSGAKLRLSGLGAPDPKTKQRGDQFVVVKIVVPKTLDEESQQLYQQLAERSSFSPRENLW